MKAVSRTGRGFFSGRRDKACWYLGYEKFKSMVEEGNMAGLKEAAERSWLTPLPTVTVKSYSCKCGEISSIRIIEDEFGSRDATKLEGLLTKKQYQGWRRVLDSGN